jgi:hypothetical protein
VSIGDPYNLPFWDDVYPDDSRDDEPDQFEPITCVSCGLEANALDATAAGWVYADDTQSNDALLCAECDAKAGQFTDCQTTLPRAEGCASSDKRWDGSPSARSLNEVLVNQSS